MTDTVQVPREATEEATLKCLTCDCSMGAWERCELSTAPAAPQATDPRDVATVLAREAATTKCYDDKLAAAQAEAADFCAQFAHQTSARMDVEAALTAAQAEIERLTRERDEALEILRLFVAHYPMGVNPMLDEVYRNARALPRKTETRDDE